MTDLQRYTRPSSAMMLRRHQDVLPDFKDRKTQGEPNPEQFVARMLEQWATLLHPFLPANSVAFPSSPQSSVTLGQLRYPGTPARYIPQASRVDSPAQVRPSTKVRRSRQPTFNWDRHGPSRASSPNAQKAAGLHRSNEDRSHQSHPGRHAASRTPNGVGRDSSRSKGIGLRSYRRPIGVSTAVSRETGTYFLDFTTATTRF